MTNFLYEDSKKDKKWFYLRWLIIFFAILIILFFSPKTNEFLPGDNHNVETASAKIFGDDDIDDLKEMRKISDSVSKKGIEVEEIAGNQWSALGADSSFFASFTKATERVTYNDLRKRGENIGAAGSYGFVLDQTGLDHSFTDGDSGAIFTSLGRLFFGAIVMVGYFFQAAVNYMFSLIATVGDYINVFKWFTDTPIDENNPFSAVQEIVQSVVKPLKSLGIVVLSFIFAISVALAIMGWRVSKANSRTGIGSGLLSSAGKLLMRFFVILLAPLLLATIFSSLMTITKDAYSGTSASDYAVYSNLVDFDKWVKYSRLALPDGNLDNFNYTLSAGNVGHATHEDVLNINADGAGLKNARDTRTAYKLDRVGTAIGEESDLKEATGESINDWAMSIVSKWTRLETVTSASYESYVRNQYMADLIKKTKGDDKVDVNNDNYKDAITYDGGLKVVDKKFYTGVPIAPTEDDYNYAQVGVTTEKGDNGVGLSSLGMYNYLSTTFDSSSFTFTRTDLMVGKAFTPYHASVGLVGRGIVAFGNYALMLATIYSIAILGMIFAMFAINAIIVSVPKALGALGGSIFGSMQNFIKMIMVIFVLAIELIGGAILYIVSQKIIVGVSMLGDGIAGDGVKVLMKSPDNIALASGLSNTGYGAINIVISLLLFFVAFMLIRYRGKILGGFATTFENAMNTLFGMFESTQGGSQAFQNGSNGMYTANDDGKNQFSRPDGTSTEFSRRKNEDGAMGGASGFNKGSQSRSSGVADPKSLLGKAVNARAGMKDAIRAKEADLGRPLTAAEKRKEVAKQAAVRAGTSALRTAGGVVGLNSVGGLADDIQSANQANINNKLADADKKEQDVKEMTEGASKGDQGETQEIKDINDYADAQDNSADNGAEHDTVVEGDTTTNNTEQNADADTVVNSPEEQARQEKELSSAVNQAPVSTGNQSVDQSAVGALASAKGLQKANQELAGANQELATAKTSGDSSAIDKAKANQNVAQAKVQEAQVASAVAGEQYVNKAKDNLKSAQSVQQSAKSKLQNALNNPDTATQEEVSQMKADVVQAEQQTATANKALAQAQGIQKATTSRPVSQSSNGSSGGNQQRSGGNQQRNGGNQQQTNNQSKGGIPVFASTKESNTAVKQAKANYNQIQQQASVAPPQQIQVMEAKVQQAHKALKNAQAGANRHFDAQPAVGLAKNNTLSNSKGPTPTNKQAREQLASVRDAHVDYNRVAKMAKPTPKLVKEAKERLDQARQVALDSGLRKDSFDNISTIKQNLEQLNQAQTEFISGTGDNFVSESHKADRNEIETYEMKKKLDEFNNRR